MKEYRIVCTRKTVYSDGSENYYENVAPWVSNSQLPHFTTYKTKDEAMKGWAVMIRRVQAFDAETQERFARGERENAFYQSDIRLQSRNVSEWKG